MSPPSRLRLALPTLIVLFLAACGDVPIEDRPLLGTLERDRYELVAEIQEPITALAVREGQTVDAGTLVATLDAERARRARDAAAAAVVQVEAQLVILRRGGRDEARTEARAQLEADRATLSQAELERDRARRLVEEGVVPRSRLDEAETAVETVSAAVRASRARLEELLVGATAPEIAEAEARLAAARAELAAAEVELSRREVRSPVAGRIDALPYRLGEQPPRGAVVAVVLGGQAWARVYVPEPLAAHFPVGTPVRVRHDGSDDEVPELAGCVRFVASDASFTPHFALSEHDRHRLAFSAEVEVLDDVDLPTGLPVQVVAAPDDEAAEDRCRERLELAVTASPTPRPDEVDP